MYEHDQDDIAVHMPFLEACASKAGIILEIGVGHGNGSTRAFARGMERSQHKVKMQIGVDFDPERPQLKPEKYWYEVHGPSEDPETAAKVEKQILEGRKADIIFIDTDHTYEQMEKELPIWAQFSKSETLWIFHDTWMWDVYNHMTDAIKKFAGREGWVFNDYSREAHGLGLMYRQEGQWFA